MTSPHRNKIPSSVAPPPLWRDEDTFGSGVFFSARYLKLVIFTRKKNVAAARLGERENERARERVREGGREGGGREGGVTELHPFQRGQRTHSHPEDFPEARLRDLQRGACSACSSCSCCSACSCSPTILTFPPSRRAAPLLKTGTPCFQQQPQENG